MRGEAGFFITTFEGAVNYAAVFDDEDGSNDGLWC
jgi:hypothetical protein